MGEATVQGLFLFCFLIWLSQVFCTSSPALSLQVVVVGCGPHRWHWSAHVGGSYGQLGLLNVRMKTLRLAVLLSQSVHETRNRKWTGKPPEPATVVQCLLISSPQASSPAICDFWSDIFSIRSGFISRSDGFYDLCYRYWWPPEVKVYWFWWWPDFHNHLADICGGFVKCPHYNWIEFWYSYVRLRRNCKSSGDVLTFNLGLSSGKFFGVCHYHQRWLSFKRMLVC